MSSTIRALLERVDRHGPPIVVELVDTGERRSDRINQHEYVQALVHVVGESRPRWVCASRLGVESIEEAYSGRPRRSPARRNRTPRTIRRRRGRA